MATRKFLTSVADVYGYDANDNLVFTAKTLLDSSIEVSLGSAPVRGGKGNKLQYIYYHTGEMKVTLTDTQWNLALLAETVGADLEQGNFYEEETVTMASASGSVAHTPIAFEGSTIYGWATDPNGQTQRVTFTAVGGFTVSGSVAGDWCVRYYTQNLTSGRSITVNANMIPSVIKLVMETQLNSADVTTNKIGIVQIIIPKLVLSGAFTISMKADGVSNTPLTGTALEYNPASTTDDPCLSEGYYAKIIEIIDSTDWYDNVYDLSISGGDFTLTVGATKTLTVYGILTDGTTAKAPNDELTFSSNNTGSATVGANTGVVTGIASGSSTITVYITSASTIDASAKVTVS